MSLLQTLLLLLSAWLFSGCQTASFYRQAIAGQCHILTHQEPIDRLIADPRTDPTLKAQLSDVLKIREFAGRELHLPTDSHYLKYVDLHRPYVVWDVYAAPELSLEPKTWWFPIIGHASYRGYFSENGARKYADVLRRKGLDVFVGGVETYSTLGWFRDPILNTFVDEPDADLAEIIFHELGHQRLFIADDTDFNEAFATAVSEEGVRRWCQYQNRPEAFERYWRQHEQQNEFNRLVLDAVDKLEKVYGDPALSDEAKRVRKKELIEQLRAGHEALKAKWGGKSAYEAWFKKDVNNAKLSTVATYYELVPSFHALLQASGNDLERFYSAVKAISKLPEDKRRDALKKAAGTASP